MARGESSSMGQGMAQWPWHVRGPTKCCLDEEVLIRGRQPFSGTSRSSDLAHAFEGHDPEAARDHCQPSSVQAAASQTMSLLMPSACCLSRIGQMFPDVA